MHPFNPDCALFWEGDMYKRSNFFGLWRRCHCELHQMELYIRKNSKSQIVERTIFLTDKTKVSLIEQAPDQNTTCPWLSIQESDEDDNPVVLTADEEDTVIQLLVSIRSAFFHNETISMSDFSILSVLGRGNFGKVTLVRKRNNDQEFYALKAVHKTKLIETNKIQSALSERMILSKNKHPFIVSLKFAFQSATKFYIGMEFLSGGDLRNYMLKNKNISFDDIKIYLAEIALALEHLHSNGIVYRDLKPENVMIADDGHIKLTDFGLSKDIGKNGSSRSMCGTLEYIAPEIVTQQSYSFSVDWWSLGILAYELIFKKTPFGDENRGRMFAKIVHEEVKFPQTHQSFTDEVKLTQTHQIFTDEVKLSHQANQNCVDDKYSLNNAKDFIKKLLVKDHEKRWSFERLKDHPFWGDMDFGEVMAKKYVPAFVPNCGPSTENFNSIYTNEEAFDSFATPPIGVKDVGINGFSFMNNSFKGSSPESPPFISSNLLPQEYDGIEIG